MARLVVVNPDPAFVKPEKHLTLWRLVRGAINAGSTRSAIELMCRDWDNPRFVSYCIRQGWIKEINNA